MRKARTKSLDELEKKYLSPKQIAKLHAEVAGEILEMNLREVRKLSGVTQVQLAKATRMAQPELSRIERREDHLLSTLRTYIEALGGEVEVLARFDDKTVKLVGV
jgi:DNA-binding XRE family transcriptional regulator